MRTKEDIKKELTKVKNELFKLAYKANKTEKDEIEYKKLFDKQLALEKELYKDSKEWRGK